MSSSPLLHAVTARDPVGPDTHLYFRGRFDLPDAGPVTLRLVAASWFETWLDGEWLTEGPARIDPDHPEYEEVTVDLGAGAHVLAFHVHYQGVETRLMRAETPLFVYAGAAFEGQAVPMDWRCLPLDEAYRKTGRRIDCILGWIEWCRTAKLPAETWRELAFDDHAWHMASPLDLPVATFRRCELEPVGHVLHCPEPVAEGPLVNMSMFTHDPTSAFVLRQLHDREFPAQGVWKRYDLGKVRLGRAVVTLDAAPGTVVQIAYSEVLFDGRVSPYISSSAGDEQSCNLNHFVLRGGRQTVRPLHPRGGRYIEVHVVGDPGSIGNVSVCFEERAYYTGGPEGAFECDDERLNRIWSVGVETLRSCAEDAITDNPTRERGQWLGDAVGAGMDILAVSYRDLRPLKRGLLQAAQCAGPDGLIPAVFPGTLSYLPSFSIQWVSAIPRYFQLTGDRDTLESLYPAAVANLRSFDDDVSEDGLCMNPSRWNFIDWGYRGSSTGFRDEEEHYTEMDPALSLFYLDALRGITRWAEWIGRPADADRWRGEESVFREKMKRFLGQVDGKAEEWERVGYHAAALALGSGLLEGKEKKSACVDYLKRHILSCFPNDPDAPRLHDTTVEASRLITPFFSHHVFPVLIEAGEADFVFDQIRTCWGWMLDEGLTTWLEVFDKRWSHCHQWSGCPTWILSRYVLGLHARFDLGRDHYEIRLEPGDLQKASGILPVPYSDKTVSVSWEKTGAGINWKLKTPGPVWLCLPGEDEPVRVEAEVDRLLSCG